MYYDQVIISGRFRRLAEMLRQIPFSDESQITLWPHLEDVLYEDYLAFWNAAKGKNIGSIIGEKRSGEPIDFFAEA
jgi:hypothetical protein